MHEFLGVLGEIVISSYDYGVIIDVYKDTYQVAHKDGVDIYYKESDLKPLTNIEKKFILKDKLFKKHYKNMMNNFEY